MNATLIITRAYEEKRLFWLEKNKANSLAFSVLRKESQGLRSANSPGAPGEKEFKKQSQFSKGRNGRKILLFNELWRFCRFETAGKQSQFQAGGESITPCRGAGLYVNVWVRLILGIELIRG